MKTVESSHVEAYEYAEDGGLTVLFKNGRTYRYDGVPQSIATELDRVVEAGESFGTALNVLVKRGGFGCAEVKG